jgi:hypothetical protein
VPANERSHDDHPVKTVRQRRRRLLTHAVVFAAAGLLATTLGSSPTSAAPTVQEGRFLQGGSVEVDYTCTGADDTTNGLLTSFGLNPFQMPVTVTSASVTPAPSPGESFDTEFTWGFTLDPGIVDFAIGLGVTSFNISNGVNPVAATTGATGTAAGTGAPAALVDLTDALADSYTAGPYSGTFNRTAEVDAPIVFSPQAITSTVTTNSGTSLLIACSPGSGAITVVDETGVAPTTTTTTQGTITPPTTVGATPTTAGPGVGAGGELPATGSSSTFVLVLLALALIDLGYLAWSAGRPARRRTSSAV